MNTRCALVHGSALTAVVALFAASAAYIPSNASAQSSIDLIFGTDLSIELSPSHPAPGESVHALARSSSIDLSETILSWNANGKTLASGVGTTEVDIPAGPLGSETRLTLIALEGELPFATVEAFIRPVELDLLWEADSYVPPFYRGRALPSAGTNLRLEAIPRFVRKNGSPVATRDLLFTWKRNGYVIAAVSGRDKSSAVIESPPLFGKDSISVEVKTLDGTLVGEASTRVISQEPRIVLYQNHPVFGLSYHRALENENSIPDVEASFSVVPYFAEAASPDDRALRYEWQVNSNKIAHDEEHPSEITINATGSSGRALIELVLTHARNLFLNSSGSWRVNLNSGNTETPFGATQ